MFLLIIIKLNLYQTMSIQFNLTLNTYLILRKTKQHYFIGLFITYLVIFITV